MRQPLLPALLAGALVLGCTDQKSPTAPADGPAFAAAEPTKDVVTFETDFTEFLPCTGENIHWTGTVTVRIHTVTNRGADLPEGLVQHSTLHVSLRLTGVGETTGGTYRWNETVHEGIQSESLTEATGSHTNVLRTHIVGPVAGLVGVITTHLVEVATPSGKQLLLKDDVDFSLECR